MKLFIIMLVSSGISGINLDLMNTLIVKTPRDIYKLPDPRGAILESLELFPKIQLSNFQKEIIWSLYRGNMHPAELKASNLSAIKVLIPMIPEHDLYRLNITDWNIVKILASISEFSKRQVAVIANAIKYEFGVKKILSGQYLHQMEGLICGLSVLDLRNIKDNEFEIIGNNVLKHLYTCTNTQLEILYQKMVNSYGYPQSWNNLTVEFAGLIPLSLSEEEIQSIRSKAIKGMDVGMLLKRKKNMINMFTQEQVNSMSLSSRLYVHINASFLLPSSDATTQSNIYLILGIFFNTYLLLEF